MVSRPAGQTFALVLLLAVPSATVGAQQAPASPAPARRDAKRGDFLQFPCGPLGCRAEVVADSPAIEVLAVTAGGPAARAGLVPGDIVVAINGKAPPPQVRALEVLDGPMRVLGDAIDRAEGDGKGLMLTVRRGDFAANLSQPLTEAFNGAWTYLPDPGMSFPHPWGAPNDSLTWTFVQPVPIVVQSGEWLVVDLTMVGNNIANFGFSHVLLDGVQTSGGVVDGSMANYGTGCSVQLG